MNNHYNLLIVNIYALIIIIIGAIKLIIGLYSLKIGADNYDCVPCACRRERLTFKRDIFIRIQQKFFMHCYGDQVEEDLNGGSFDPNTFFYGRRACTERCFQPDDWVQMREVYENSTQYKLIWIFEFLIWFASGLIYIVFAYFGVIKSSSRIVRIFQFYLCLDFLINVSNIIYSSKIYGNLYI